MSSSNINDPASVAALLEQLRASSAWQQIVQTNPEAGVGDARPPPQQPTPRTDGPTPPPADTPQPTVAELLAQLSAPPAAANPHQSGGTARPAWDTSLARPATNNYRAAPHASTRLPDQGPECDVTATLTPLPASAPVPITDVRSCSFQEALPLLARLGEDPCFVTSVKRIKQDQDVLERQLSTDRGALQKKYADRVKVAKTRATMTGANGLSKHEATMLQDAYQKEMCKFDRERVLPAWDGLITRQQGQLEALGVPNMFVTSDPRDTERQKQIINVLLGLVGNG
ncbi:hypothetical protein FA13DRAFT_1352156 [Coprinellus micaceus]|uniref:Uncharacterized protein n=1 Tax=Coprinellus micaceus TaxID=71717 RepID=A0A4Y7TNQ7_COPMI|nr:hypothetical protein FA13DRAFT_1352156 [Coprinellus micaceus]